MNADQVRVSSPTEDINPRTQNLDQVSTLEALTLINAEDALVPGAVLVLLPILADLVDRAAELVRVGGRVHYFGAGTSGRLGVLDAAELLPTFGIEDDIVIAHQAGGSRALVQAVENAEDDESSAAADAAEIVSGDVVLGLAASGRTPYVHAALRAARGAGAVTALVTSNPSPPLADLADFLLIADTGAEAIAGSTRLKAGSALKLVLNSFSTALMIRLGHTYRNLMVDMQPTNAKLRGRSIQLLHEATGAADAECERVLDLCGDIKTSVVYLIAGNGAEKVTATAARAALQDADGHVRGALERLFEISAVEGVIGPLPGYRPGMSEDKTDIIGATDPDNAAVKDPHDWVTGDEPMTAAQRSYLETLAREAGEQLSADLTKAEASEHIDRLQQATGRGDS